MLLAVLEFWDFAIIALIVMVLSGGAAASARLRPADRSRMRRIESKLDMVLAHLGLKYTSPSTENWQELANDPARKIEAIKAYRQQHGADLATAKQAVEYYIEGRGNNS